jgi:RimJ/RimL family protein N-acetyltransferase
MARKEFHKVVNGLKGIAEEKLMLMVEVNGEPAAFAIGILDYHQVTHKIKNGRLFPTGIFKILFGKKKINRNRIVVLGVRPKFQKMGLGPLMYLRLTLASRELGLKRGELSWILEDNVNMIKPMKKIGAEIYKTYRMFEASI